MTTQLSQNFPETGKLRLFTVVATLNGAPYSFYQFGKNPMHAREGFEARCPHLLPVLAVNQDAHSA